MTGRWFQVATSLGVRPPELVPSSRIIRESIRFSTPPASRLHFTSKLLHNDCKVQLNNIPVIQLLMYNISFINSSSR
jgi:hypothetical protein